MKGDLGLLREKAERERRHFSQNGKWLPGTPQREGREGGKKFLSEGHALMRGDLGLF